MDTNPNNHLIPPPYQPVVIKAQKTEQIYKALGKRVEQVSQIHHYYQRSDFTLSHAQIRQDAILIGSLLGLALGVCLPLVLYLLNSLPVGFFRVLVASVLTGIATAVATGFITYYRLISLAMIPNETEENTLSFDFLSQQAGEAETSQQQVIKLEIKQDRNTLKFIELPDFLGIDQLIKLANHAQNGGRFSRAQLQAVGVCSQGQYPALVESFSKADMLEKQGKSHTLTDLFFETVNQLESE